MDPQPRPALTAAPPAGPASNSGETPVACLSPRAPVESGVLQRTMLLILALTVASTCLLSSAPEGSEAGARPWGRNSVLRVLTTLTNLDYQFPTRHGSEI